MDSPSFFSSPEMARQRHINERNEHAREMQTEVDHGVDRAIELLTSNRGHIGSIAMVLLAKEDDALLQRDGECTEGAAMFVVNSSFAAIVTMEHMEMLIRRNRDGSVHVETRPDKSSGTLNDLLKNLFKKDGDE